MKKMLKLMLMVAMVASQTALPMKRSADAQAFLDSQLFEAVSTGKASKTQELLCVGANPNNKYYHSKDYEGITLLMVAADKGFTDTVEVLLKKGAEPNTQDCEGFTALHRIIARWDRMAQEDFKAICNLLLEYKADPDIRHYNNDNGITPRDLAKRFKCAHIFKPKSKL